jgi:hypothetical protein
VAGRLRYQVLGRNVVVAARLCDWIGKIMEGSIPARHAGTVVAATEAFYKKLPADVQRTFTEWGEADFKGFEEKTKIFLDREDLAGATAPWRWPESR